MSILDGFDDVADILKQYEVDDLHALDGCEVLFATYECANYEGHSQVIYRDLDGELYEVCGSHCSCMGLEGQWDPARVTVEALKMRPNLDPRILGVLS